MRLHRSTDQMGDTICFNFPPRKIISLVPSQTELLFDLGLGSTIAGLTKFCIHPEDLVQATTIVGGTKTFNFSKIDEINPDLIIGNKEENYHEGISILKQRYPVWMSDVYTLEDALAMISEVGAITDRKAQASSIVQKIGHSFSNLIQVRGKKVIYLIWRKPWMAAGSHTFIGDILKRIGLVNVIKDERYPQLTDNELTILKADIVLLSSEPYPFSGKHLEQLKALMPGSKFYFVDGEMFSWYGSRLQYSCDYFKTLPFYEI